LEEALANGKMLNTVSEQNADILAIVLLNIVEWLDVARIITREQLALQRRRLELITSPFIHGCVEAGGYISEQGGETAECCR
jgi:hypothetical protein